MAVIGLVERFRPVNRVRLVRKFKFVKAAREEKSVIWLLGKLSDFKLGRLVRNERLGRVLPLMERLMRLVIKDHTQELLELTVEALREVSRKRSRVETQPVVLPEARRRA